jgi:hypothetical protein
MARHNKILQDQSTCIECEREYRPELLREVLYDSNRDSLNMLCHCGKRYRLFENINGFLIMRKYIKKKDQVKRAIK